MPILIVIVLLVSTGALLELTDAHVGWTLGAAALACAVVLFVSRRVAAEFADDMAVRAERVLPGALTEEKAGAWLRYCESVVDEGRERVRSALEQIERGEQLSYSFAPLEPRSQGAFEGLEYALVRAQREALEAVVRAAECGKANASGPGQSEAEVIVYIARRLHTLVSRTLSALSTLENNVEDPDLLHDLFSIDHLVTQTRRAVESLAVLGGETPRRVIKPLLLTSVLRQAVAEIEQYPRVRVSVPREELALRGYVGPDVIHLLAELVENGTKFSPRSTKVLLRAENVPAGVVVEVEDRGLPMTPDKLERLNKLLAAPQDVELREQLRDGHIGLLVAARLAQRHGIRVELRTNLLGGTQALVVLPHELLVAAPDRSEEETAAPGHSAAHHAPSSAAMSAAPSPVPTASAAPAGQDGRPPAVQAMVSHAPQAQPFTGTAWAPEEPAGGQQAATVERNSPVSTDRPALPKRSEAPREADQPAPESVGDRPSGPPTANLMAQYAAGVRRSDESTAADGDDARE